MQNFPNGLIIQHYKKWLSIYAYGDGFTDAAYSAKMIKMSNTGVTQWIKSINKGSSFEFGKRGQGLMVANMQFTPDGNVWVKHYLQDAKKLPSAAYKYPNRIVKYTPNVTEV